MSTVTVLVVLHDDPRALTRLLVRCNGRGWEPVALRSVTRGGRCEVAMRLRTDAPAERVRAQLERLVEVEHVAVDAAGGVPDGVAFAAVRRKAGWVPLAA